LENATARSRDFTLKPIPVIEDDAVLVKRDVNIVQISPVDIDEEDKMTKEIEKLRKKTRKGKKEIRKIQGEGIQL